jgi:hypothetical protein
MILLRAMRGPSWIDVNKWDWLSAMVQFSGLQVFMRFVRTAMALKMVELRNSLG